MSAKQLLKECPFCGVAAIEWHFAPVLPDDDVTVLAHFEDREPELAYHGDGQWWTSSHQPAPLDTAKLIAWCHTPYPPDRKPNENRDAFLTLAGARAAARARKPSAISATSVLKKKSVKRGGVH